MMHWIRRVITRAPNPSLHVGIWLLIIFAIAVITPASRASTIAGVGGLAYLAAEFIPAQHRLAIMGMRLIGLTIALIGIMLVLGHLIHNFASFPLW